MGATKHSGREGAWANAINRFMEGFVAQKKRSSDLEELAADRAIKERQMKIMENKEQREALPGVYYDAQTGQYIKPPMGYGKLDIIPRQMSYVPTGWENGKATYGAPLPPGQKPFSEPAMSGDEDPLKILMRNLNLSTQTPGGGGALPPKSTPTFSTIEEANSAHLPIGTEIVVGGRKARVK